MATPTDPAITYDRIKAWALDSVGSTRTSGLLRIGLALTLWARYASELLLYKDMTWRGLAFAAAFFLCTTAMLVGYSSRVATFASGSVAMAFVLTNPPGRNWNHHHTYLLALATLLVALTPCGRSYSLDRWLAQRRADREGSPWPSERANLFGLRLISLQLATMYLWTASDKLKHRFISGDKMEAYLVAFYTPSGVPKVAGLHTVMMLSSAVTIGLELALAFGLFFPRARRWLLVPGLVMHALFFVFLPVSTFSVTVACLYLAVLDADAVHAFLDRLQGVRPTGTEGVGLGSQPRAS